MNLCTSILVAVSGAALLGSCASTSGQETRSPKAQKELDEALAGRTAGAPVSCLPNWRSNDMQILDDNTILFRDGGTVYVQNPRAREWVAGPACSARSYPIPSRIEP